MASGGFDSAVLNPNNESYSDMLNFNFYAKAGCLNISCLSSVFYFICSKMINVNYREMQSKINSYFQFREILILLQMIQFTAILQIKFHLQILKTIFCLHWLLNYMGS